MIRATEGRAAVIGAIIRTDEGVVWHHYNAKTVPAAYPEPSLVGTLADLVGILRAVLHYRCLRGPAIDLEASLWVWDAIWRREGK